jgi:hypothetical protein
MNRIEVIVLLGLGIAIWVLGTIYYSIRGQAILETSDTRYWVMFVATPIFSAALCVVILRLRHIPAAQWANAMLLLALPGMVGEAILLTHFAAFMPRLQAATSGKYAALLFAAYAVALGIAAVVTLRAR